jgi:ribose transport system permease protein
LLGVARAFSLTAIVAIGQTMVIITGGIDLSVGSVLALSGITTGMLLGEGWPLIPAMICGVLAGSCVGLANGLLITFVGLPPFIATLGTLSIGRGLVYILTQARALVAGFGMVRPVMTYTDTYVRERPSAPSRYLIPSRRRKSST